ncbi:MAG: hypothetical protein LJE68_16060 [Rhodobacter sp.]|nr:hypothetical protein [Rhodobacter sp.]
MNLRFHTLSLTAFSLALALVLPLGAIASERLPRQFDGKMLKFSELKPNTVAVAVATSGKPDTSSAMSSSSDGSNRRPVIVDGVWMELPEWVILGQIKSGFFIVVYPGTNIPWTADDDRHPFYPPPYIPGA